jgi:hypothetical protein
MSDRDDWLRQKLEGAAAMYQEQGEAILGGGSVWAGSSHYVEVAALLRTAADAMARLTQLRDEMRGLRHRIKTFQMDETEIIAEVNQWADTLDQILSGQEPKG